MASSRTRNSSDDFSGTPAHPDYYAALGVAESATSDQIKRAYRATMKQIHPDRASASQKEVSERQARFLNEAYRVLTDPAERNKYDIERRSTAVQEELMSRYFGGFGMPGGRTDVYDQIMAAAREEQRHQRRKNDRHATRSLLTMFAILLLAGVVALLLWGIAASIGGRFL